MYESQENALRLQELSLGESTELQSDLNKVTDKFDCLNLSGVPLAELPQLPYLPRLKVLLLNDAQLTSLPDDIGSRVPNLHSLSIANNRIDSVKSMGFITGLVKLRHLVLLGNPISKTAGYSENLQEIQPNLKFVDFQKVITAASNVQNKDDSSTSNVDTRKKALLARLENAQTMDEIDVIECELASLNK